MAELPTRPMPRGELQILRTRHPPTIYLHQLCDLFASEGISITPEELNRRLQSLPNEDRLLMAVEGDQLIGYAHLSLAFDLSLGLIAEIETLIVQPQRRREGFGRQLIAAAESWARQAARTHLRIRCHVAQTAGQALLNTLEYQQQSTRLDFIRELNA